MTKNWIKTCMVLAGVLLAASLTAGAASGDQPGPYELTLPSTTLPRTGSAPAVVHLSHGFTGHVTLHICWTDSLGRVVDDRTVSDDLFDGFTVSFRIDLSRALAMENKLHVDVTLDGKNIKGEPVKKQETAETSFVSQPPYTGWRDYAIMMWQPYPANLIPELKKLGVDGATYSSRSPGIPDFLTSTNTRWYAESLATDYYSQYHRYFGDRDNGWYFIQAKKLYKENPNSLEAFKRHPSFWDPYWRKMVHDRGVATGRRFAPYRPYFYSLADESGIAELEAQWDFGFSDQSLAPMRRWLRAEYGSLGSLNQEWGTHFTDWNLVVPMTTNQAMQQKDDNFSAWADLKNWMDISYADALKMGADAIREGDPHAYVGIGGGQMPGWGGYDYARITQVLTEIEPYDIGRNVDIIHSLNPAMPILTTSFAAGPQEEHRVWYELMHGNRGLIIWDSDKPDEQFVMQNGQPSKKGEEAGKYYNEIRDGVGALIINSHPVNNLIAVHYSQPSMRTQWMLERRPDGEAWMSRSPEYERTTNDFMRLRESWCDLIEDQGLQPDFVSYMQVADGDLLKRGFHVLVLPESSSLSHAESTAIRNFIAAGGVAIADGIPGTYDEHSRKLPQSSLADLFGGANSEQVNVHPYGKGKAILLNTDITGYLTRRVEGKEVPTHRLIQDLLRSNGVRSQFAVEDDKGNNAIGIDTHVYADGGVRIVALTSNPQLRVNELGPPDFRSNERFLKAATVHLHLPGAMYVYDTRARKALGPQKELTLTVDPYQPTILVVSDTPLPEMQVSVPDHAQRGSVVHIAMVAAPAQAAVSVFHVEVRDPQGKRALYYSGNVIAKNGSGVRSIPFAFNDATGKWTVTVQDMLSGQTVSRMVDVE